MDQVPLGKYTVLSLGETSQRNETKKKKKEIIEDSWRGRGEI
jgi:hypothetical protein